MATETVRIRFLADGTRIVEREIQKIERRSKEAGDTLGFLKRALLGIGAATVIRGIIRTADAFTNLQNRIRLVTNSTQELNKVTLELLAISNRTRSSLDVNANLFNRLALSTKELQVPTSELLKITESLNQAVLISGATAQEAQAGLIQLSQGLASGTLRGDELRSVLEQLPVIADVISKSLGVTRGELRKLGAQGEITAQVVLKAFIEAREELAERFAKVVPTVAQAFVVLKNNITVAIGELNKSLQSTESLGKGVLFLAENVEELAFAIGTGALVPALLLAASGVKALTLAIAANPLGLLLVGLSTAISLLTFFRKDIIVFSEGMVTLEETASAAIGLIVDSFDTLVDVINGDELRSARRLPLLLGRPA